jgi:hypothetical protein
MGFGITIGGRGVPEEVDDAFGRIAEWRSENGVRSNQYGESGSVQILILRRYCFSEVFCLHTPILENFFIE